jgi:ribulose-phosphate 3-epimerase
MISIAPAILADDPDVFNAQMQDAARYATRVHIDLADGIFTGNSLQAITDIWWPGGMRADLHIMYERPFDHTEAIIALGPQLVIVHAEAEGDFLAAQKSLHGHGIELGVALLAKTPVEAIVPALEKIDHVLIFSGDLGHYGGHADLSLLEKAKQLKQLKPTLEIGWDGGVNDEVAPALVAGGVDVLNAGGYLHGDDPIAAYHKLLAGIGQ